MATTTTSEDSSELDLDQHQQQGSAASEVEATDKRRKRRMRRRRLPRTSFKRSCNGVEMLTTIVANTAGADTNVNVREPCQDYLVYNTRCTVWGLKIYVETRIL